MLTRIVFVMVLIVGTLFSEGKSHACDCAAFSPKHYFDNAEMIFVARAEKFQISTDFLTQRLNIFHALKGKPGNVFEIKRPANVVSSCDRGYQENEVSIVFVKNGKIDLCNGNYGLDWQGKKIATYLSFGKKKAKTPKLAAFQALFNAQLLPYLHDRPQIPVLFAPLKRKKFKINKTKFVFSKKEKKGEIKIDTAILRGPLVYISGFYPTEGFEFSALMLKNKRKYEVLFKKGAERKGK